MIFAFVFLFIIANWVIGGWITRRLFEPRIESMILARICGLGLISALFATGWMLFGAPERTGSFLIGWFAIFIVCFLPAFIASLPSIYSRHQSRRRAAQDVSDVFG